MTKQTATPQTAKTTQETSEASGPSTMSYSTRLDPSQRECVEAAAQLKKWSPAKLIREAAVTRAADIVNACSGPNRARLRELAHTVARQVFDPQYLVRTGQFEGDDPTAEEEFASYYKQFRADLLDPATYVKGISVLRPSGPELDEVAKALRSCATEFVEMLLEEWRAYESTHDTLAYAPQVDVGRLLGVSEAQRSPEESASEEASD